MKKFITFFLCCSLALTFCFPGVAYAQGEDELPDPGITPDSPFYFFDTLGKKLGLVFTFGDEAKAKKALDYAEERLAEANAMALTNKLQEMTQATGEYEQFMATVNERLQATVQQNASTNISEKVALATQKHLDVMDRVRDRVPEEGQEALDRAQERSLNEQLHALRALAEHQPERATEINLDGIQNRLHRALEKASENATDDVENATDDVENAIEDAEKLRRFGQEISEIARGLSDNTTTVDELVARATSVHLEVMAQVHDKVPEPDREAIENAMANALQSREQVIERLRNRAALGDIPEDVPALQQIQAEVMERIQNRIQDKLQQETDNQSAEQIQERIQERLKENVQEQTSKLQEAPDNMLEQLPEEAPIPEELPGNVNQKIAPGDSRRKQ